MIGNPGSCPQFLRLTIAESLPSLLSVRYGRPPLIQLSHVGLDASLRLPFSDVSNATTASSLEFFNAILYGVISDRQ